jgi:membrane associated rhomboid family serine protease
VNSWVVRLIAANVVVFVLSLARPAAVEFLAYVPALALERPWTVITYMFLHGDFGHIAFNMLGLLFFGPRVEAYLGSRKFLWLYFLSGIVAAAVSTVFSPMSAIIGASGAVYGVFLGFAFYWPREVIRIWGVFPIEARWMVLLMTLLSLYGGFGVSGDNIAHFAHLGGFVGAYVYLKSIEKAARKPVEQAAPSVRISQEDLSRWATINPLNLHEVNREELERIRRKIETQGVGSLTQTEAAFMNRFSSP